MKRRSYPIPQRQQARLQGALHALYVGPTTTAPGAGSLTDAKKEPPTHTNTHTTEITS